MFKALGKPMSPAILKKKKKGKKNINREFESSEDVMRNPFPLLENVQGI